MGNIVRLSSGGQIQVRTGVLSGVGPQGPRGMVGPPGADGAQGPQGETGPIGHVTAVMTRAQVSSTTQVIANTTTAIAFATVAYDDLGACTSSTQFTIKAPGDYLFTAWAQYDGIGAPTGYRQVWLHSSVQNVLAYQNANATVQSETHFTLSWPVRVANPGEVFTLYGRSAETRNISAGSMTIIRVGAGLPGATGPQGPQGYPGPAGPKGDQGLPGSAGSGFATYGDLT